MRTLVVNLFVGSLVGWLIMDWSMSEQELVWQHDGKVLHGVRRGGARLPSQSRNRISRSEARKHDPRYRRLPQAGTIYYWYLLLCLPAPLGTVAPLTDIICCNSLYTTYTYTLTYLITHSVIRLLLTYITVSIPEHQSPARQCVEFKVIGFVY